MDVVLDDWFWDHKKGRLILRNEAGDISIDTQVKVKRSGWSWPYPVDGDEWSRLCVGCFRVYGKIGEDTFQKWLESREGKRLVRRLIAQQHFM